MGDGALGGWGFGRDTPPSAVVLGDEEVLVVVDVMVLGDEEVVVAVVVGDLKESEDTGRGVERWGGVGVGDRWGGGAVPVGWWGCGEMGLREDGAVGRETVPSKVGRVVERGEKKRVADGWMREERKNGIHTFPACEERCCADNFLIGLSQFTPWFALGILLSRFPSNPHSRNALMYDGPHPT